MNSWLKKPHNEKEMSVAKKKKKNKKKNRRYKGSKRMIKEMFISRGCTVSRQITDVKQQ